MPSVSFVSDAIQKGAKNRLIIEAVSNIGVSAFRFFVRVPD